MLNFGQENASVYRSKEVHGFLENSKIPSISWPSKSLEINITEDVWKMISDLVYSFSTFTSKQELASAINGINRATRHQNKNSEQIISVFRNDQLE